MVLVPHMVNGDAVTVVPVRAELMTRTRAQVAGSDP
jgi:hypothetical protein